MIKLVPPATLFYVACVACLTQAPRSQPLGQWSKAPVLDQRSAVAMTYDPVRQRTVLFGGFATARFDETWEWDGTAWTLRTPTTRPPGRRDHALVYDSGRNRVVLFGGNGATGGLADTWEWDGSNWTQRVTANAPASRDGHGMAYDAARGKTVLFGGQPSTGISAETWTYDGTNWTQLTPAVSPPGHALCAMVYDTARQRAVLFGGNTASGNSADTWEWDGTTWSQVTTPSTPPIRQRHALAFDSVRGRAVLFGGSAGTTRYNDTWEYDGSTWTQKTPATSPLVRDRIGIAFDPNRARTVLFSGRGPSNTINQADTWEWDGANWVKRADTSSPVARDAHGLAYDSRRQVSVLFGGATATVTAPLGDTWEWDGATWTPRSPASSPSARQGHALAYDAARGTAVLFGGSDATQTLLSDTWTWNGTTWTQVTTPSAPPARSGHAMAWDSVNSRVLLFGGAGSGGPLADFWAFDGTQWLQVPSGIVPPARSGHALAFDASRNRVVLFGGSTTSPTTVLGDTWEYDGIQWAQSAPVTNPAARRAAQLTFDGARGVSVLFGGRDLNASPLGDTWEWNGTTWTGVAGTGPSARSNVGATYDALRRRCVLHGGIELTALDNDTWEYAPAGQADVTPLGSGCPGTFGVPLLAAQNLPSLGTNHLQAFTQLVANTPVVLALGGSRTTAPLGVGGCTLYVGAPLVTVNATANGAGAVTFTLTVPNLPALAGGHVWTQGVAFDPNGSFGNALAFSRALDLALGN